MVVSELADLPCERPQMRCAAPEPICEVRSDHVEAVAVVELDRSHKGSSFGRVERDGSKRQLGVVDNRSARQHRDAPPGPVHSVACLHERWRGSIVGARQREFDDVVAELFGRDPMGGRAGFRTPDLLYGNDVGVEAIDGRSHVVGLFGGGVDAEAQVQRCDRQSVHGGRDPRAR